MIIISDTSPISNLILIGQIFILRQLFETVIVPPAVDKEIKALKALGKDISAYETADWITVRIPTNDKKVLGLKTKLDAGEAEAISLALEIGCDLLLIDERLGTKVASDEGLRTLGLVGVLIRAKSEGLISEVGPVLNELEIVAGFWIGDRLKEKVLDQADENQVRK